MKLFPYFEFTLETSSGCALCVYPGFSCGCISLCPSPGKGLWECSLQATAGHRLRHTQNNSAICCEHFHNNRQILRGAFVPQKRETKQQLINIY